MDDMRSKEEVESRLIGYMQSKDVLYDRMTRFGVNRDVIQQNIHDINLKISVLEWVLKDE